MSDLLASSLTPQGRGAVATVRLLGDWSALEAAGVFYTASGVAPSHAPIGRVLLAHWGPPPGEDIVLCRTTEDVLDIHCHGGQAAVSRILADAAAHGARVCSAREFLEQSVGPFDAECLDAVSRAPTLRTAEVLLEQSAGTLRSAVRELIQHYDPSKLDAILQWSEFGRHLTKPWLVVLTGAPNVGKSSLINRLVGYERSIVNAEPGTTRDVVTAETALDGWPIRFEDTAGLREGASALEEQGIFRARDRLRQADLILIVYDLCLGFSDADLELCREYPQALLVGNKCDLAPLVPRDAEITAHPRINVSCVSGTGLDLLTQAIVQRLVPQLPERGSAIPVTERQIRMFQAARTTNSLALDSA